MILRYVMFSSKFLIFSVIVIGCKYLTFIIYIHFYACMINTIYIINISEFVVFDFAEVKFLYFIFLTSSCVNIQNLSLTRQLLPRFMWS